MRLRDTTESFLNSLAALPSIPFSYSSSGRCDDAAFGFFRFGFYGEFRRVTDFSGSRDEALANF